MKDRASILFLFIFLAGLIVGCSSPKTLGVERKSECGCGTALTLQEDMGKIVMKGIFERVEME
jgi:hypothetical protein